VRATRAPAVHPTPQLPAPRRLDDRDILEIAEAAYEAAAWYADLGMIDFDAFAELAKVMREMRDRIAAAGGAA
jgi:hypothetical protein